MKFLKPIHIYIVIYILSIMIEFVLNEAQSLYEDNDPMIQFTNDTILSHLSKRNKLWVVEFYSSWCGHCQIFAPKWRRLAYELKNWNKYLNVGVINCAAERNLDTCSTFQIDLYPSIRFFKPGWKESIGAAKKEKKNWGDQYDGESSLMHLRRGIIDRIEELDTPNFPKPNFDLVTEVTVYDYLRQKRLGEISYKYLGLVFEEPSSYTGKILSLDAENCNTIAIRRVAHTNAKLTAKYSIVMFPSLVLVNLANGLVKEISKHDRSHEGFVKALNKVSHIVDAPPEIQEKSEIVDELQREKAFNRSSDVYMVDLVSALSFTLRREIPKVSEVIENKPLDAMKRWINLLSKCFPGEAHTKLYLSQLDNWVQLKSRTVKSSELLTFLDVNTNHDSYLLNKIEYRACQGSSQKYRGFPCTLWVLFHTLTVNCDETSGLTGFEVLDRIRNFIDYFFGCRYCRDHFVKMAETIDKEVQTRDDAILWLWSRHNWVNARLKKSMSSDPVFPKIQFPEDNMCEDCRKPTDSGNTILENPGYDTGLTKWNKRVVLKFLKDHYGVDNIRVKKDNHSIVNEINEDDNDAVRRKFNYLFYSKSASPQSYTMIGLNHLDMSMCLVLYVAVLAAVIGLYVYFIRRRTAKQHKYHV